MSNVDGLPYRRKEIIGNATLYLGDVFQILPVIDSADAVITDPPYGIRFMGKAWDGADIEKVMETKKRKNTVRSDGFKRHDGAAFAAGTYDTSLDGNSAFQAWTCKWAVEARRLLKPGAHLLSFASPRTYHRMTCGVEDAGFEIRDQLMWIFGSGFPKSHNLQPFSLLATKQTFEQWGTALKPAHEPICLARKPLDGAVLENVLGHGTGALNIEASRIPTDEELRAGAGGLFSHLRDGKPYPNGREGEASSDRRYADSGGTDFSMTPGIRGGDPAGRWPANVLHDGSDEVLSAFPQALGQQAAVTGDEPSSKTNNVYHPFNGRPATLPRGDTGSAARFFYCAKASKEDRDEGLHNFRPRQYSHDGREKPIENAYQRNNSLARNHHPTVKPTDLMRYLCRLITPPAGVILDPFLGSGSTGKAAVLEGFRFIGIEREEEYFDIACARLRDAQKQPNMFHELQYESSGDTP
jgi:DNA modification methylase